MHASCRTVRRDDEHSRSAHPGPMPVNLRPARPCCAVAAVTDDRLAEPRTIASKVLEVGGGAPAARPSSVLNQRSRTQCQQAPAVHLCCSRRHSASPRRVKRPICARNSSSPGARIDKRFSYLHGPRPEPCKYDERRACRRPPRDEMRARRALDRTETSVQCTCTPTRYTSFVLRRLYRYSYRLTGLYRYNRR